MEDTKKMKFCTTKTEDKTEDPSETKETVKDNHVTAVETASTGYVIAPMCRNSGSNFSLITQEAEVLIINSEDLAVTTEVLTTAIERETTKTIFVLN